MRDRTLCRHITPRDTCKLLVINPADDVCNDCKWYQTQEDYQYNLKLAEDELTRRGLMKEKYRADDGYHIRAKPFRR